MASALGDALPAKADEDPETLIRQGVQLRKKGQDAKAHGYFKRAYEIGHTPRAAAQLGLSDVALKQWLEADTLLREALASSDPWVSDNHGALEKGLGLARVHLGGIKLTGLPSTSSAEASVGGAAPVKVVDGTVLWSSPGNVALRIAAEGFKPLERELSTEAGKTVDLRVDLVPLPKPPVIAQSTPPPLVARPSSASRAVPPPAHRLPPASPPPEPAPSPTSGLRVASFIAGGVGVAALGAGLWFRHVATTKLDAARADGSAGRPYDPANGNFATFDRLGVGCLVGGGVALAAGVVGVILTGESSTETNAPSKVAFGLGPSGTFAASLTGTF